MQHWAVYGWGFLFVVIALCAFVLDRDMSVRDRKLQAGLPEEKRRRNRFPWVTLIGSVAVVAAIGYAIVYGGSFRYAVVPLIVHIVLFSLLGLSILWFFAGVFREGNLARKAKHVVRSLGFGLWHLMAFLTILGVSAGAVRAYYPNAPIGEQILTTLFFTVIISLITVVAYLGTDTLFFGRGSGRRANRLREIEKRREEEEF